jgi:crossover junction endodeoxyribonuclease RuvC
MHQCNESIIGIDLSMADTGVCYLGPAYSETISVKTKPMENRFERYNKTSSQILAFIDKFPKCKVVIEDYAYSRTGKVFHIGEFAGVIKNALYILGYEMVEVSPTALKKFTTGKGNADKKQMIEAAHIKWGILFDNHNKCDAYALAQWGYHEYINHKQSP